jgi:hypothetical protein
MSSLAIAGCGTPLALTLRSPRGWRVRASNRGSAARANVRIHGETQQRPVDLFAQERPHLGPLDPNPYDLAHTSTSIASSQFRITLDTNQYSVPAAYAHRRLTVKDHAKGLIAQRSRAREQRLMMHFLALSPDATAYYDGLEQRRFNTRHYVRKILALAEINPADAVARAISDGLAFQAFSAEYITNILESWRPPQSAPGRRTAALAKYYGNSNR